MKEPLAWYIAGPLIGLIVPLLLILTGKQFGISSSYRYIISIVAKRTPYFQYERGMDANQLIFALGLILSGVFAMGNCGSCVYEPIIPKQGWQEAANGIYTASNWLQFLFGGILVGFGSRYANGCTAGHCIMGVAQFSKASIVATICFFIGGLVGSYFINPLLF